MSDVVKAIHNWPTNADLIADVASLYLEREMKTLDLTYGRGLFWTKWRPIALDTNDIRDDIDTDFHYDFKNTPLAAEQYDLVVYDPPYKLSGTPELGDFDDRYGIHIPRRWQDRMEMIVQGFREAARLTAIKGFVLAKCQDQVVSGAMRWQTFELMKVAKKSGLVLVDRFDMLGGSLPQPEGRRQVHARGRGSTLLVFQKVESVSGSRSSYQ